MKEFSYQEVRFAFFDKATEQLQEAAFPLIQKIMPWYEQRVDLQHERTRQIDLYTFLGYHNILGKTKEQYRTEFPEFLPVSPENGHECNYPLLVDPRIDVTQACTVLGITNEVENYSDLLLLPNEPYAIWVKEPSENGEEMCEVMYTGEGLEGCTLKELLAFHAQYPDFDVQGNIGAPGSLVGEIDVSAYSRDGESTLGLYKLWRSSYANDRVALPIWEMSPEEKARVLQWKIPYTVFLGEYKILEAASLGKNKERQWLLAGTCLLRLKTINSIQDDNESIIRAADTFVRRL